MLDRVHVQPGWRCLDLACGPYGMLGPLSRRVGPTGQVVGADINPAMLAAARNFSRKNRLGKVDLVETDLFHPGFRHESFDLVHARFMIAPLGREDTLLDQMVTLTRPGGIILSQESDEAGYVCFPAQPAWERLKQLTITAFSHGGGDYSAGRQIYSLMRRAGLENVQARAAILALPAGHPYRMWPIESAIALRQRMLEWKLVTANELDQLLVECTRIAGNPEIFLTSYAVIQVWGRKPEQ